MDEVSHGRYGLVNDDDGTTESEDSMTNDEIQFLKRAFDLYDNEKNGWINVQDGAEILEALTGNYFSETDVQDLIKLNNSSVALHHTYNTAEGDIITIESFLNMMNNAGYTIKTSKANITRAFSLFDNGHKGHISVNDIKLKRELLGISEKDCTDEDLDMMIRSVQENSSGNEDDSSIINLETFIDIMG